jgi:hypothetical protein
MKILCLVLAAAWLVRYAVSDDDAALVISHVWMVASFIS